PWNLLGNPSTAALRASAQDDTAEMHAGVAALVRDCNQLYRQTQALYECDTEPAGFEWIDFADTTNSVLAFERRGRGVGCVVVVINATPVVRYAYRIGVSQPGRYREAINTDSAHYGGSNVGNEGSLMTDAVASHGRADSLLVTLPPLATVVFTCGDVA
ncbi:MAG: alpha amylase C-terminal domain-containing protein, partial [Candidatus Eremiobacteraeota bacterium]|nr:alpha amylase C-terminal domain-containing protein [Candidatus Eremiobacteraeota bacterium]